MDSGYMARPLRIASIGLLSEYRTSEERVSPQETEQVMNEIDRVGKNGVDLILTPEIWTTEVAIPHGQTFTSPLLDRGREKARFYQCYIALCMRRYASPQEEQQVRRMDPFGYWKDAQQICYNSIFLIDRKGAILYVYDKVYPYMSELLECDGVTQNFREMQQMKFRPDPCIPGKEAGVVECDFGRLGLAICFDANFPLFWQKLAQKGAEIVAWSSAYDGGLNLQAHAASHHYYIVSCTCIANGGCRVVDPTGREQVSQLPLPGNILNTLQTTLNLDRTVFHKNFNEGKLREAMNQYPGKIGTDFSHYSTAEWISAWSLTPEFTMQDICQEFGLVPLQQFKTVAEASWVDAIRGGPFS